MLKLKEIGIDLGSNSIKIAVIEKTGRSKRSLNPNLSKLEQNEVYEVNCTPYSEEYYQLLKDSIKSFSKKHKLKRLSLNIAISVDNINSHVHFINIPVVNDKLLDSGISFEAEQKMAIEGIKNSYSTWKIINKDDTLNEYEILLANIKKEIINSLAQFKTIKWKVNRVILQPILLERVVDSNDIIIDLGHESTRVYSYVNGKLSQIEIIEVGGKDILKDIEDYLKENFVNNVVPKEIIKSISIYNKVLGNVMSENDSSYTIEDDIEDWYAAEDIYDSTDTQENSTDSNEAVNYHDEIKNVVSQKIEIKKVEVKSEIEEYNSELLSALSFKIDIKVNRISDEIKRIIRMFELQNSVDVDKVYYFGQLSNLGYFKETLESELEMELKPLDILDINSESQSNLTLHSVASLVAMDTKLKDDTNFSKLIKANIDYSSIIIMLLSISLSTGFALKVVGDNYSDKIEELQSVNLKQLNTIHSIDIDINEVEIELNESIEFVKRMDELSAQKKWLSDMLYIVPEITPLTIAIKDMNIISKEITIEGYSSDYSSIGFFANKLKEIADVNIDSIDEFTDENVFSVTMDNPELISEKYRIKHTFKMTLTHAETLLEHGDTLLEDE